MTRCRIEYSRGDARSGPPDSHGRSAYPPPRRPYAAPSELLASPATWQGPGCAFPVAKRSGTRIGGPQNAPAYAGSSRAPTRRPAISQAAEAASYRSPPECKISSGLLFWKLFLLLPGALDYVTVTVRFRRPVRLSSGPLVQPVQLFLELRQFCYPTLHLHGPAGNGLSYI